ncbi:hypothetical protein [Streptomyces sp. FH025]|uniref:hypothetical protein n=1 Tax=Streptomyces sp. FH025 TaxID=2815937 RepID=UPI001A9F35BE|nr:hypothetical protein [Streptomyces sp. FH025]MBO1420427.1 hypothetical protein [Streptomyces sp. FH025]
MPEDARPVNEWISGPQNLRKPSRRWRGVVKALWIILRVLIVAAGLAVTVLGFARFTDAYDEVGEYRATPLCATPAAKPGADCVTRESGRVTRKSVDRSSDDTTYNLTVARETAPAQTFEVGYAFYDDVDIDTTVDLKVLRGRVVNLSYHGHLAKNPNIPWADILTFSALLAAGMAVAICGIVSWKEPAWAVALGLAVPVWIPTVIFGGILTDVQWGFTLSLVLGIICWLVAALISTVFSMASEGF